MQIEPTQGRPEEPEHSEQQGSEQREAGEVQRAIQEQERVMLASVKLPPSGAIPENVKRQVCERVQAIRKNRGISLAALCKHLRGTPDVGLISQVLRRTYGHEDSDHIRALNAWAESIEREARALRPAGICDTGVVRAVRTGCDYAKSQRCMVLLSGPAGIGKSIAAQVYASEDLNAMFLRVMPTHRNQKAFLGQLCEVVRVEATGTQSEMMDRIITRLRGSRRLLILDEWHLAERPLYECVRTLYDVAEIPICLIGTEEVSKQVTSARLRKGAVWSDQFCSRIGWVVDLTKIAGHDGEPRPLFTIEEIREVFRSDQVRISQKGVAFLQAIACCIGVGCLRMAQRCYSMAARMCRGQEITEAHLRKAFRRQAVPEGCDDSALLLQVEETAKMIRAYSLAG